MESKTPCTSSSCELSGVPSWNMGCEHDTVGADSSEQSSKHANVPMLVSTHQLRLHAEALAHVENGASSGIDGLLGGGNLAPVLSHC